MTSITNEPSTLTKIASNTVILAEETSLMVLSGYYCGHAINYTVKLFKPAFMMKGPFLNPVDGAICGGAFMIIDQIAKAILIQVLGEKIAKNPRVIILRLAASVAGTSALLISQKAVTVQLDIAATLIAAAIAVYTLFLALGEKFDVITLGHSAEKPKESSQLQYPATFRQKLAFLMAPNLKA